MISNSMPNGATADRSDFDREIHRLAKELSVGIAALGAASPLYPVILSRIMLLASEHNFSMETNNAPQQLTNEQMNWANQQFTDADYMAGLRDIEQNGGVRVGDLLAAVTQAKDRL